MDENGEVCLGLGLGLGLSEFSHKREDQIPQKKNKHLRFLDLSITVHPNDHEFDSNSKKITQHDHDHEKQDDDHDLSFSMNFGRKKLRLSRDQTTLLEDSFRQHTTLNTAQKQTLAEKLNLKPRQVEVWFQNRRARTKLKQTEVECEILKKNCERLSEENRRLKKELIELRSSMKTEKPAAWAKSGTGRGGGEAAAAVMEVVHEPNDERERLHS